MQPNVTSLRFSHSRLRRRVLALGLTCALAAPQAHALSFFDPTAALRVALLARIAEAGAVLVGAGTVRADDPSLTARGLPAESVTLVRARSGLESQRSGSMPSERSTQLAKPHCALKM